jgi:RND family efflux transporter MFP subunit
MVQKLKGAQDAYREARKGVEAADENRKLQEITYRRYKKLYEEKALTGQEFDQLKTQKRVAEIEYERAKAALSRAEAGVNEAKVYHGFTRLTSPVKGIVTEKKIEVGSMAVPGVPLATVEDNSSYRIEIGADEKLAGRIKIGMAALISVDSLNSDVTGRVTDVVPSVDPMSRSFLVKIGLKTEGLRNGLYGRVSIPVGRKEALLVPRESLVERGQLTGVYVVGKDEVITYRLIKTGRSYGGKIEVLAGLSSGERVIVKGVESAVDGGLAAATAK